MFLADRFFNLMRWTKTSEVNVAPDSSDTTRRVIELSDEIADLNKRILARVKLGEHENLADRERLNMLLAELKTKPSTAKA